ncbi:MAG TPA: RsmG family class I SAM-dependent methyltransferase, partial [bacterium]|nr:RsmG family class I SAM-dependent methyltransferase [bacterium]
MNLEASDLRRAFEGQALASFFPASQEESLARFTRRMLELNQGLNLTKWTQPEEALVHHVLDSAFGIPLAAGFSPAGEWMDLGTGGGFPGALMVAAFPKVPFTFVDAVAKKGRAVADCLEAAGWKARVLTERAEVLGRDPAYRDRFEGVVARAVADLPVLLEYALPFLKPQGHLLSWMTQEQVQKVDKAKKAIDELGARI